MFIKVTEATQGIELFIRPERITTFLSFEGVTYMTYEGGEGVAQIKETPEELIEKIRLMQDFGL